MQIKMTIDECLEFADEWSRGITAHEGSQGWRVVCMLLAEEVRRLRSEDDITKEELIAKQQSEIEELKNEIVCIGTQLQFANIASHSLASMLCRIATVCEKDGYSLIQRESVMELVVQWRKNLDSAMNGQRPNKKEGDKEIK
jgi:hypothetical protein